MNFLPGTKLIQYVFFFQKFHFNFHSPDGDLATQERWMTEIAEDFGQGKILGWYRGPRPVIYATDPAFLKEVFIKESETFIDRPMLDRSDNIPHLIMLKGDNILGKKTLISQSLQSTRNWLKFSSSALYLLPAFRCTLEECQINFDADL